LESGFIHISRAMRQARFPAQFQLVAAMNPCPCGYLGDPSSKCRCTREQVARYRGRISGPLLDRIDLHVEVPRLPPEALSNRASGESSARVRERVIAARHRQLSRSGKPNHALTPSEVQNCCVLDPPGQALLNRALKQLGLSARAYHRILKVARTIADLSDQEVIQLPHLTEAIGYRRLDRNLS